MPRTAEYDVFISYRWTDPDMSWVREHLVPALQSAGVRTLLDIHDFVPGRDLILEMERAGRESRFVLCILTPAYFEGDRMVAFESLSARRMNPSGSESRLIPLLFRSTKMPDWIRGLIPIDWTDERGLVREWSKLLRLIEAPRSSDPPHSSRTENPPKGNADEHSALIKEVKPDATSVVRSGRFEATVTAQNRGNLLRCRMMDQNLELRYGDIIQLWQRDQEFVDFYISIFRKCGFLSYVWETPPVSNSTIDDPFEFVLCSVPAASEIPDRKTYASYFDTTTNPDGIVAFRNLGGDAILVTPSPQRADANYSNLVAFFREAPISQQRALWREVAMQIDKMLSNQPLWVSVAAGGISWLHVRLDSSPKYYRYSPYAST